MASTNVARVAILDDYQNVSLEMAELVATRSAHSDHGFQ